MKFSMKKANLLTTTPQPLNAWPSHPPHVRVAPPSPFYTDTNGDYPCLEPNFSLPRNPSFIKCSKRFRPMPATSLSRTQGKAILPKPLLRKVSSALLIMAYLGNSKITISCNNSTKEKAAFFMIVFPCSTFALEASPIAPSL